MSEALNADDDAVDTAAVAQAAPVPPSPTDPNQPDAVNLDAAVAAYMRSDMPTQLLKGSVASVVALKPDHEAALRQAAAATGVPLDAARADPDYVRHQATVDSMGLDSLYATHPATAQFLSNPDNAAVAHDDVGPLKATENVLGSFKRSLLGSSLLSGLQSAAAVPFRFADALADAGVPIGMSEHDYNMLYGHDPVAWKNNQWQMWAANSANALQRWSAQTQAEADPEAQGHLQKTYSLMTNGKMTPLDQLAELDPKRVVADTVQNLPTLAMMVLLAKGAGAEGDAAAVETEAAGGDAAAVKAARTQSSMAYLAKNGAVTAGAVGYAQQANQTYEQVHDDAANKPAVAGSDYKMLLDAGFEADIAQAIVADRAARSAGVQAGIIDAGVNLVGGGVLGKIIGEGGQLIPRVAKGAITEGVTGSTSMGLDQVAQNRVEQTELDPNIPTMKNVAEVAGQGGLVSAITGASMAGVAGRAHHDAQAAQDALSNADALATLTKVAQASKLNARDTSTFQGFIRDAAQDGPVQDVWLSADGLKQSGVDPAALIAAAPEVTDQINDAVQTGGDMRIPVERFATLPEDVSAALLPHVKTDPTGMSQAEANEFMQNFGPEMKQEVEQALAEKQAKDDFQTSSDNVRAALLDKLTTANRFTSDVNGAYADMGAAFYTTMAQRLGTTPEDVFNSHPVDITAEGVAPNSFSEALSRAPDLAQDDEAKPATTTRGSFNPDTNKITLLKNADLSTFLHESGHFYLETMARFADAPDTPQQIKDDFATTAKYMGHEGVSPGDWLAKNIDDRREGHEAFARGFEQYLMEGKAPSQGLRGVFQRFKSWLTTIYRHVSGLRVNMSDDMRGVMDRLLATDDQIVENEKAKSYGLMPDLQNHMTPDEWTEYQRLGAQATQDAQDGLSTKSLKDMEWLSGAKDRALKKLQDAANTKRKGVQGEVSAEVMAEPVNQARTFLKHGLGEDGTEVEGPHKLDIDAVDKMYADTPKELQDWRKLGTGKYGMLGRDGLDPEHVAELFGFSSGDELVEALLNAQPSADKIKTITDQRMIERYGDLSSPAALEAAADEAVHNDARLRFVATEANALAKATGRKKILVEAAKAYAAEIVGRLKVRDLKPSRFSAAETRAAVAAEKAAGKGDLVEAATQKRNQLINGYAAKAAFDAQDEVNKAVRFFNRFQNAGTRAGMDGSYRDQIDALLERFDLKPSTTLKEIARRKSLASWYDRMKAQDQEPMISDELLNEAYTKSYKDMSMDELRGLRDAVAQIAHLGRLKNRLLAAKNARDFATTVEELTHGVEASAIGKPRDLTESNQIADKIGSGLRGFFVIHRKFDSLVRRLGGFQDDSTAWRTLVRPKNEAADMEATRVNQSTKTIGDLYKILANDRVRQKKFIPELGTSLSLEGRLSVLLNWGNETNRARVRAGDNWTDAQVAAVFKTLEPRHFEFAQKMLDHINSFRPEIEAAHKRRYGVEPPMEEAAPFSAIASDGSTVDMRGGYYPIKYDPNRSAKAQQFDAMATAKAAIVGSTRGYVKPGFVKARVDDVQGRPLSKSLNVAYSHVNEVIHDLAWGDYLIDAKRLLANDTLANSIRAHAGPEVLSSLRHAVEAMEVGDMPAQNDFQRGIQYLNSGSTLAALGWNVLVSMKHPLGLFNGAARIGPQWVAAGLKQWVGDAASLQNTVAWVHANSDFMASRANGRTISRDLQDVHGNPITAVMNDAAKQMIGATATNKVNALATGLEHSFYWMIEHGQMIADIPVWLGQYQKSMSVQEDHDFAVQQANQAVRDSQTTGGFSDLSEIQRGPPLAKLFTKFYSYFSVVYNQLAESVEETQFKGVSNVPALAGDVMLALILPSLLGASLERMLPSGDKKDDWGTYLGKHLMGDLFGTMVGVRDLYAAFTEDKDAPAGFRFLKNTADLGKQVEGGHLGTPAFWKALNAEAGPIFHYPAATVQRFVTGIQAMADGTTRNPMAVATGGPPKK